MNRIRSCDAEIAYTVLGEGPPLVLLHPFPVHHEFWLPAAQALTSRYRIVMPDVRGHGESDIGEGPATMEKHAGDLARVLDDADVGRAVFAGVSIGGYILFEFWRRYRGRVAGLALCCTRAQADTAEGRAGRLKAAEDVLERGTEPFIESMLSRVFSQRTLTMRPDLVEEARGMMRKMSPADIAEVQRGMAQRPDSVATLASINVPTLLVMGEEDRFAPAADGELMRSHIAGSSLAIIPQAGHFAVWEQPEEVGRLLRQFVDACH
ncbi:MAG: alpha/beta hydrolase [Acidobacteria bacterium]|nr:MAG: alpha/beta hydrolase [Acidobacteriota bacterium]